MSKALTTEEFIRKAKLIHGDKYDYSKTNYINGKTKICIICPEHDDFWQKAENHIHINNGCPKCSIEVRTVATTFTTEEFIQRAKLIHNNKYDYSKVEYINSTKKICIICPEHGEFWQISNSHLNKRGCPKCGIIIRSQNRKMICENFIQKAKKIHNNKYDYSNSFYIQSKNKIEIICTKHGSFWQTSNSHLNGAGCPKCQRSKGEEQIEYWLKENNIQFETQKQFKGCKHQRLLPFDFYLPKYNMCIEFDGRQHFKPIWNQKSFNSTQQHDNIKDQYCLDNNIDLLRIPYTEFKNINKLLTENICTC
jgi:very-short-patch-repair endonuclease